MSRLSRHMSGSAQRPPERHVSPGCGVLVPKVGLLSLISLLACGQEAASSSGEASDVQASLATTTAMAAPAETTASAAGLPKLKVYKTASCGCCSLWVDHMRDAGFEVEAEDVSVRDLTAIKLGVGLSNDLFTCHTAIAGDYAFEGHIPAEVIARFLAEDHEWRGLAVPGMPIGSPGMEMGDRKDPYQVLAFGKDGKREVYESR